MWICRAIRVQFVGFLSEIILILDELEVSLSAQHWRKDTIYSVRDTESDLTFKVCFSYV